MAEIIAPTADLTKFSEIDNKIAEIKTNAKMLKITDPEDKKQFDLVHDTRMVLVKMRTQGIEPIRKEIVAPLNAVVDSVNAEAKKRTEQLKEIEAELQAEEDKVLEHRKKIQEEKARKAQEKVQERLNKMKGVNGCTDLSVLGMLTDDEFEFELKKATEAFAKQQEEEQKQRLEKEAEEKRIAEEKEKLLKDQEEIAKKQKEIDDQKAQLENEKQDLADKQKKIDDENKRIADEKLAEANKIIEDKKKEEEEAKKKLEEEEIEKVRLAKAELAKGNRERLFDYVQRLKAVEKPVINDGDQYQKHFEEITQTLALFEQAILKS